MERATEWLEQKNVFSSSVQKSVCVGGVWVWSPPPCHDSTCLNEPEPRPYLHIHFRASQINSVCVC